MTKEKTKENARNKSLFNRFLDVVERAGNKLPHPIVLFGLFALGVLVISGLLHACLLYTSPVDPLSYPDASSQRIH